MNNSYSLEATSPHPDKDGVRRYHIVPSGYDSKALTCSVNAEYGADSASVFDDDDMPGMQSVRDISVNGKQYKYVQWGYDDQLPYRIRKALMANMVTARVFKIRIKI